MRGRRSATVLLIAAPLLEVWRAVLLTVRDALAARARTRTRWRRAAVSVVHGRCARARFDGHVGQRVQSIGRLVGELVTPACVVRRTHDECMDRAACKNHRPGLVVGRSACHVTGETLARAHPSSMRPLQLHACACSGLGVADAPRACVCSFSYLSDTGHGNRLTSRRCQGSGCSGLAKEPDFSRCDPLQLFLIYINIYIRLFSLAGCAQRFRIQLSALQA